ncbi:MAG: hypothetical protein GY835_20315 [bacterium]|nr:hypothetical protein [bacterium]
MAKLIIAGDDHEVLPLLEQFRIGGEHEVLGLGATGPESLTSLYAGVMSLPLLQDREEKTWTEESDFLVSNGMAIGFLPALPCLSIDEARRRFLENPVKGDLGQAAMNIPPSADAAGRKRLAPMMSGPTKTVASALPGPSILPNTDALKSLGLKGTNGLAHAMSAEMKDFAFELRREISRSQRHHLSFCLTFYRLINERGDLLPPETWRQEPLNSFHKRFGRSYDSWGMSGEGILLHLAPETLEQMRPMRHRLERDLEQCSGLVRGGPWTVCSGSVLFPQDGSDAYKLIEAALVRLERNLTIRGEQR